MASQLQMREPEGAERALVQGLSVLASTGQPGGDGRLPVALRPARRRKGPVLRPARDPHLCDLLQGGFQTVQGRVASGSERGVASPTAKGLDALGLAMLAIPDKCVDVSVGDPEVHALLIGTGESLGVDPLGRSPPAFDLAPGTHRRRSRSHNRRVGAAEATGGAIVWGARLQETVAGGAGGPS